MVVDVETRAASDTEGNITARACDACMRRTRASWYCPADDAFLCQSCDASIHSANHLAKQHERVRLQSSSSPELMMVEKTTSVWYEGFRRKARTPRSKGFAFEKVLQNDDSNEPRVPELDGEEDDGVFSFSSTDENEESLNCCVPVFDPFSDMGIDDINSFGLVSDGVVNKITSSRDELGELERAIMGDEGLNEFLPLDVDLEELTMDVESLLEEEQLFLGVKEVNDTGLFNEENSVGVEFNCEDLKRVKDEEVEEAKCENRGSKGSDHQEASVDEDRKTSLLLRLDYEAVISAWDNHGLPWKTGIKPEVNLGDGWREHMLGRNMCPSHVMGGFDKLASTVRPVTQHQSRDGGGSEGEREARVLRYKEKRRTRLFAKKIRYEVRKINAEQRPRIKGRFVKRTLSLLT